MTILMISGLDVWSMGEGKGAQSAFRTLKAFSDAGHTVHLVLPGGGGAAEDGAGLERVHVHRVAYPRKGAQRAKKAGLATRIRSKLELSAMFPAVAAWEARSILRREKIDVLYGYEIHGVLAVSLLKRFSRLPVVSRFQGTIIAPHYKNAVGLLPRAEHLLALRAAADLHVMTDDGTQGDVTLTRLNPRAKKTLRFWRNGIDLERFHPADDDERAIVRRSLSIASEEFVVVSTSRLVPWKRVDRIVRVWPRIASARSEARLLVVGSGEERSRLTQMANRLGIQDSVRFVGSVKQEGIVDYLHAADVFISVNDLSNAGNPLMEAMACGKAIVTLDNGSTGELITDGVTGRLLAPDDDEALASAVIGLAEDADYRHRLEGAARQYALEHFWSWDERMAAEVAAVAELVADRRDS